MTHPILLPIIAMMKWDILESKYIVNNDFLKVRNDKCVRPDGVIVKNYYSIEKPDVVIIGAFTPENDLILIEQYRHPVRSVDLELPAGYLEPNESLNAAAARELLEETGFEAESLTELSSAFASAGNMTNKVHFFIGKKAKKIKAQNLDDTEDINIKILS
ncbi:NUDIX hydrolase, partial [Candidatus Peregrinibacteria bacterium]|nr:NUDIX hydrolase [Candidatus Peregrinibacteria bacterium]